MFRSNTQTSQQSQTKEGENISGESLSPLQPIQPGVVLTGAPVIQSLSDYLSSHQAQPIPGSSNYVKIDSSQMGGGSFGGAVLPAQRPGQMSGEFQSSQSLHQTPNQSPSIMQSPASCCSHSEAQMMSPTQSQAFQQSPSMQHSPQSSMSMPIMQQQQPISVSLPMQLSSPLSVPQQPSISSPRFQQQPAQSFSQQFQSTAPSASQQFQPAPPLQTSFPQQQVQQPTQQPRQFFEKPEFSAPLVTDSKSFESKYEDLPPLLRPHLPPALDQDIVGFLRSRLHHVPWPIWKLDSEFKFEGLKPLGHAPISPMLCQQIRNRNWQLRPVGKPLIGSLRARLGPDFVFPDYMNQRVAFLSGKPPSEPASLLSRDRDYEHARPASIADRVKDVLHVGHTGYTTDASEQKSVGTEASGILDSLKARLGLSPTSSSGGIVSSIKHKLGMDKPRVDASFFESTETPVNYSASGGIVDSMKSTMYSVKDKLQMAKEVTKEKISNAKESLHAAKVTVSDKLEVAKETVKDKLEVAKETVKDKLETAKDTVTDKLETAKETVKDKLGMNSTIPAAPPVIPGPLPMDRPSVYYGSGLAPSEVVAVGYTTAETSVDPITREPIATVTDISVRKLPDGQSLLKEEVVIVRDMSAENSSAQIDANEHRLSGM